MDYLEETKKVYEETLRKEGVSEDLIRLLLVAFETGYSVGNISHDEYLMEDMKVVLSSKQLLH